MNIFMCDPSGTYTIELSKYELAQLIMGKSVMFEPSKTQIHFRCFPDYEKDSDCHALHCRESTGDFNVQFLTIKLNHKGE